MTRGVILSFLLAVVFAVPLTPSRASAEICKDEPITTSFCKVQGSSETTAQDTVIRMWAAEVRRAIRSGLELVGNRKGKHALPNGGERDLLPSFGSAMQTIVRDERIRS